MGRRREYLEGKRYGRLTVVRYLEGLSQAKGRSLWLCKCDCGNECIKSSSVLSHTHSVSCGCYKPINERDGVNEGRSYLLYYNGEKHTIAEWSQITGIKYNTLYARLRTGMTTEVALTSKLNKTKQQCRLCGLERLNIYKDE